MSGLLNFFQSKKDNLKSYYRKSCAERKRKREEKLDRDLERMWDEEYYIRAHKHDPEFLRSIGNTSYLPEKIETSLFLSDVLQNKKRRF